MGPGTVVGCTLYLQLAGYSLPDVLALGQVVGCTVACSPRRLGPLGPAQWQAWAAVDPHFGQGSFHRVLLPVLHPVAVQLVCLEVCRLVCNFSGTSCFSVSALSLIHI